MFVSFNALCRLSGNCASPREELIRGSLKYYWKEGRSKAKGPELVQIVRPPDHRPWITYWLPSSRWNHLIRNQNLLLHNFTSLCYSAKDDVGPLCISPIRRKELEHQYALQPMYCQLGTLRVRNSVAVTMAWQSNGIIFRCKLHRDFGLACRCGKTDTGHNV